MEHFLICLGIKLITCEALFSCKKRCLLGLSVHFNIQISKKIFDGIVQSTKNINMNDQLC